MKKYLIIKILIIVAIAAYVSGTKAGRSRYRKIESAVDALWNDREVRKLRGRVGKRVRKAIKRVG